MKEHQSPSKYLLFFFFFPSDFFLCLFVFTNAGNEDSYHVTGQTNISDLTTTTWPSDTSGAVMYLPGTLPTQSFLFQCNL